MPTALRNGLALPPLTLLCPVLLRTSVFHYLATYLTTKYL